MNQPKEREPYFGLPDGAKDTRQLRTRFKNYIKEQHKRKNMLKDDIENNYKLRRDNDYYHFNKPEYDNKSKTLKGKKK
jgi:hypothetical protein